MLMLLLLSVVDILSTFSYSFHKIFLQKSFSTKMTTFFYRNDFLQKNIAVFYRIIFWNSPETAVFVPNYGQ